MTQNTKRFTRCFWALDKNLAYARHYPAINWTSSYSEYLGDLAGWYKKNVGDDFIECRNQLAQILQEESKLMEIVKLIGADVLPDDQKLVIEAARVIRVGFLQQNAYHKDDTYVPLDKQLKMMRVILYLYKRAQALVAAAVPLSRILSTAALRQGEPYQIRRPQRSSGAVRRLLPGDRRGPAHPRPVTAFDGSRKPRRPTESGAHNPCQAAAQRRYPRAERIWSI